jgi:hypothetical protein
MKTIPQPSNDRPVLVWRRADCSRSNDNVSSHSEAQVVLCEFGTAGFQGQACLSPNGYAKDSFMFTLSHPITPIDTKIPSRFGHPRSTLRHLLVKYWSTGDPSLIPWMTRDELSTKMNGKGTAGVAKLYLMSCLSWSFCFGMRCVYALATYESFIGEEWHRIHTME